MANITFKSWQQTARFHNPLKGGELDAQQIEVRLDPLTDHQSITSAAIGGKLAVMFPETDEAYLRERAEATEASCFLCNGKWQKTTPRYAEDLIPGGRMVKGEAVLFPNLFPVAAYHAIVMVGNRHFRALDDFSVSSLFDALSVSFDFMKRCHATDPEAIYFTINCNYLFPAGASVVHPHLQILGSPFASVHHQLLLDRSHTYFHEKNACYWLELTHAEKQSGVRWIGELGESRWFTAFSPLGANEVNAVWPTKCHFLEWRDDDILSMAEGISKVLRTYHELKFSTFNFSCFGAALGHDVPEFRCFLRLINRQNVTPHYRTDDYYFQKLLNNEIIIHQPENLASLIRRNF
jgi:galactose-1-phosphate uridylyltransferase